MLAFLGGWGRVGGMSATNEMSDVDRALVGINAKTHFLGPDLPGLRRVTASRRRLKGAEGEGHCYHVMSRLTGDVPMWDALEKEALAKLLWKMAAFCGLEVMTYCVMGNHFHALVHVPNREKWCERFAGENGEEAFFEHLRTLYTKGYVDGLRRQIEALRGKGMADEAALVLDAFMRRFCDVSVWTKEVKERFSKWLNKRRDRRGTLWMERFKSVLVQDGEALATMALYIDLNPVRARLDKGSRPTTGGVDTGRRRQVRRRSKPACAWRWESRRTLWPKAGQTYRTWLFTAGAECGGGRPTGAARCGRRRGGIGDGCEGEIVRAACAGLRLRRLSDGIALGSRDWVEEMYASHRDWFGKKRKSGARPLAGQSQSLFTLRS